MTLASKFVGMNIKKLSDALSSASTITAAIEITDAKDASRAVDAMRKSVVNGKGSILVVAIRI
jgi:hypothetical protein